MKLNRLRLSSTIRPRPRHASACLLAACALALSGCAGYQNYRDAQTAFANGESEQGVAKLREAMAADPGNAEYRRAFFSEREARVQSALSDAQRASELGAFDLVRQNLARAAQIDPSNVRVAQARARVDGDEGHWRIVDTAIALAREDKPGNLETAIARVRQVLSEDPNFRPAVQQLRQMLRRQAEASAAEAGLSPKLRATFKTPVSLSFTNASLLQVFQALKQVSGLNYLVEHDVRPEIRVTLSVTNKPVEDLLRLVLSTNQLDQRILDDNTLLIYPNTPAKQAEYKEMVVRSFYLNHADATKVAALLKTIAKLRDVVVDEKLNMIVVRDSEESVRLSEKIIAMQDIAEPEVMLELEVMEVSVNRLLQMGIQWPSSISASVTGSAGVVGQLALNELRHPSSRLVNVKVSNPALSAQLTGTTTDANLLANPRVRVVNKQKAKVLIGERLPVITATTTANVGTSDTVSYLDVGLKLEIEPTISLDDEVSMNVALEVSNVLGTTTTNSGTQAYTLGTRNTSTSLQVHDGETNILAGLIQRDQQNSNTGIPGLNEMPVLGKLFGQAQDSDNRTEIVLLITPHIVRNLDVPGVGRQEFKAGTDSSVGASPIQLGAPGGAATAPGRPTYTQGQPPAAGTPGNGVSAGPQPSMGPQPSTAPLLPPRPTYIAPPGQSTTPPPQSPSLSTPPLVPATPNQP
jgi:general secretion pathway protein D